jgi:hypothetical protein
MQMGQVIEKFINTCFCHPQKLDGLVCDHRRKPDLLLFVVQKKAGVVENRNRQLDFIPFRGLALETASAFSGFVHIAPIHVLIAMNYQRNAVQLKFNNSVRRNVAINATVWHNTQFFH